MLSLAIFQESTGSFRLYQERWQIHNIKPDQNPSPDLCFKSVLIIKHQSKVEMEPLKLWNNQRTPKILSS